MSNRRFAFAWGILFTCFLLSVLIYGCGDTEQAFSPTESAQKATLDLKDEVGEINSVGEGIILVAIPKTGELKEIYDPWIADAILSMLSDATLAQLAVMGSVYVNDTELAGAIVAMAGMEAYDVSGGILLADDESNWGCIKCLYADEPYCEACPQCCEPDKDTGRAPII